MHSEGALSRRKDKRRRNRNAKRNDSRKALPATTASAQDAGAHPVNRHMEDAPEVTGVARRGHTRYKCRRERAQKKLRVATLNVRGRMSSGKWDEIEH